MIAGTTRVFAVLGDPVAHSLSPAMHNAAFRALGLPAVYVALRCNAADVPGLIGALARANGGGNVTVPHKEVAARAVDRRLGVVEAAGACNTFWGDNGAVVGENTDVPGLLAALDRLAPADGPWLIAGTGGGARAAAIAARTRGVAVAIQSRRDDRRRDFEAWATSVGVSLAAPAACQVLLNTTPLGLQAADPPPVQRTAAPEASVALDMVYRRGETSWVRAMRAAGLRAADGREMLVAQGARAFERWFPGKSAPVEVMRAAVAAALR